MATYSKTCLLRKAAVLQLLVAILPILYSLPPRRWCRLERSTTGVWGSSMDKLSGGVARGLPAKGWPVPEVPAP